MNLDIYRDDAFGLVSATDRINKEPHVPGRIGAMGIFDDDPVATTTISLEERAGVIELVQTTQRGGPAVQAQPEKRTQRAIKLLHLALETTITADDIQNLKSWGGESELETAKSYSDRRAAQLRRSIGVTQEWHKLGALKGEVRDADGTTVLYNLFTEFGVTQVATWFLDLDVATAGALMEDTDNIARSVQDEAGNIGIDHVHALVGKTFMSKLVKNAEVRESYQRFREGEFLRDGHARKSFPWGGLVWEEYRGKVGSQLFVGDNEAIIFPVVEPGSGLYKIAFGPADFMDTANTLGRPFYERFAFDPEFNRWVKVHLQSNILAYATRPRVLQKASAAAS